MASSLRCVTCVRTFGSLRELLRHRREQHNPEFEFECLQCTHVPRKRNDLRRHYDERHPDTSEEAETIAGRVVIDEEGCHSKIRRQSFSESLETTRKVHRNSDPVSRRDRHQYDDGSSSPKHATTPDNASIPTDDNLGDVAIVNLTPSDDELDVMATTTRGILNKLTKETTPPLVTTSEDQANEKGTAPAVAKATPAGSKTKGRKPSPAAIITTTAKPTDKGKSKAVAAKREATKASQKDIIPRHLSKLTEALTDSEDDEEESTSGILGIPTSPPLGPTKEPLYGPLSLHAVINDHCVSIKEKSWVETFTKKGALLKRVTFTRQYELKNLQGGIFKDKKKRDDKKKK